MIGDTFGNFRVVSRIGRGGMGEVYLAEQQSIGTRVAIKLLHAEISEDKDHVQRFFNEARAVSRIQHAGILKIFDSGFHPQTGQAYLVMEYLDGESLASRIRRGRLSLAQVTDVCRQIASVLDATHAAGITHRDLKPDNIFLVPDRELASRERVKVLDFGIAKLTGTLASGSPRTTGTMGTPAYMAPEQWGDSSKVDWRADLYALGCLTFEMICGRPPFDARTFAEACAAHLTMPPPSAQAIEPAVPGELNRLLLRLLAKDPSERPQSAQDVALAFEAIARDAGSPITSGPTAVASPPPPASGTEPTVPSIAQPRQLDEAADRTSMPAAKKRSLALPIGLGAVAVAGIAGVSGYVLRDSTPDKPTTIARPSPDAAPDAVVDALVVTPDASRELTGEQESAFGSLLEHTKKQFETCYAKHGIKASNDVLFIVDADASGAAQTITLEDAPPAAAECLRQVAMGLAYPKTAGGFEHSYWQRIDAPKPAKRPTEEPVVDPVAVSTFRAGVLRQLKTVRPMIRRCRTANETSFSIAMTFRDDGGVKRIETLNAAPGTQQCIGDLLAQQMFPAPPPGMSRTITIPFAFPARLRR